MADILTKLEEEEDVPPGDLRSPIVSATVAQDNNGRNKSGRAIRFRTYGEGGEQHGYIATIEEARLGQSKDAILKNPAEQVPELIEAANEREKKRLREAISQLTWREFESNFMAQVLEALGFSSITITQSARDGGADATCQYTRGIVRSEAYVSAKKWKSKVGVKEVRELRGLPGRQDTGIIFTTARFTGPAKEAAEPQPNARSIVLIDGDLIVEACFSQNIGVENVPMPKLSKFVGFESEVQQAELEG